MSDCLMSHRVYLSIVDLGVYALEHGFEVKYVGDGCLLVQLIGRGKQDESSSEKCSALD